MNRGEDGLALLRCTYLYEAEIGNGRRRRVQVLQQPSGHEFQVDCADGPVLVPGDLDARDLLLYAASGARSAGDERSMGQCMDLLEALSESGGTSEADAGG